MRYWKPLGVWTLVLTGVVLAYSGVPAMILGNDLQLALTAWGVVRVAGALLPFVAFAAGAAVAYKASGRLVANLLLTAVLAYAAVAWADPVLQHQRMTRRSADSESTGAAVVAQGPDTPVELLRRKGVILADPPGQFSFRVEEPLLAPPNWIDFRLHSPVTLGLFALLNGFLGALLGRRRSRGGDTLHRLWLFGLLSGVGFMAPMMVAESLVRASVTASGVLAAWAPLVVPLAALAVAAGFARHGPWGGAGADFAPGGGGG